MDNEQKKYVNLSFVAASMLFAIVFYYLSQRFSVMFDIDGRVRSLDVILKGGSAAIGAILFLGLLKSNVANTFMNETVTEVRKVTWPTHDETLKATIAVLIAVTVAGTILWVVDNAWIFLISQLI